MAQKKRDKKYNPKRAIMQNEWMNEDYIVYGIDSIAMGVRSRKTGRIVVVGSQAYNALQHGICERSACAGVLYRRQGGEAEIELIEMSFSRCTGEQAMTHINARTREMAEQVGLPDVLGRFYFITGKSDTEWNDVDIYSWLEESGAFALLYSPAEITTRELQLQEQDMKSFDPVTTQVGGSHYSDMKVQPRQVIIALRMNWDMGNALKYVARFKAKNGVEDLKKAYDYTRRALHDGFGSFNKHRTTKGASELAEAFIGQFTDTHASVITDIIAISRRAYTDADKWQEDLTHLLFNINFLCEKHYATKAY